MCKKSVTMRKIKAIAVLYCITLAALCQAQSSGFLIGAESGAGPAWLRGITTNKSRLGYTAGLFVQYDLKKTFSLRTGAYYDLKGAAYQMDLTDVTGIQIAEVRAWNDFHYLTVPLLLRATFGKKINYFINAGPYVSFLLKQRHHYPAQSYDNSWMYNQTDMGVSLGIGLSYAFDCFVLSAEARSSTGLANINASKNGIQIPVYNGGEQYTNAINIQFGLAYRMGKKAVAAAPAR